MIKANSPGTVQLIGLTKFKLNEEVKKFAIIMQKMDGSLKKLMKDKEKISEAEAIIWTWQLVDSYRHL